MTDTTKKFVEYSSAIVSGTISTPTELASALAALDDEELLSASLAAGSALVAYAEFMKLAPKLLPGISFGVSLASFGETVTRVVGESSSEQPVANSDYLSLASDTVALLGAGAAAVALLPVAVPATTALSIFAGVSVLASTAIGVVALAVDDPGDSQVNEAMGEVFAAVNHLKSSYPGYDAGHYDYFVDRFFVERTLDNGVPITGTESLHHIIFEAIDPGLPLSRADSVFGALSNQESLGAERLIREVELLLGTGQGEPIVTEEQYIDRSLALKDALDNSALLHVVDLAALAPSQVHDLAVQDSDQGRAVRYSLVNLLPFAVGSGLSGTAADTIDYEWNSFSSEFLGDRSEMLAAVIQRNQDNAGYPASPDGEPVYYLDSVTGEVAFVGQEDLSPGAPLFLKEEVRNILFGSREDDASDGLIGGTLADRIYGLDGDDVLSGSAGDDYLEGGDGADTLSGGMGADTLLGGPGDHDNLHGGEGLDTYIFKQGDGHDIIADTDLTGVVQIRNASEIELLLGHQSWESEGVWGRDGEFSWQGQGTDLIISGAPTGADASITIENFHNGDFGIYLSAATDAAFDQQFGDSEDNSLVGDAGQDQLFGSQGNDELLGQGGDDELFGSSGNDTLDGGDGHDVLYGASGDDKLYGGAGSDDLFGSSGDDHIEGGDGNDRLFGSSGINVLYGGDGADQIYNSGSGFISGGAGPDDIYGGSEVEVIDAGSGNDILRGALGADTLFGGSGHDIYIYGQGHGFDTVSDEGPNTLLFSTGLGPADLAFQLTEDGLLANTGGDTNTVFLPGFSLQDISNQAITRAEFAGGESYSLTGLLSSIGHVGEVYIDGADEDDTLNGDWTQETIRGLAGNDQIFGYGANDVLLGGPGNDNLWGMSGDDRLVGGEGDDSLDGGDGNDHLEGGPGDDVYHVFELEGSVTVVERKGEGHDTVLSDYDWNLAANVENLELGEGDIFGIGNKLDNTLLGGSGNNKLNGRRGNDVIAGGRGDDTLIGKKGNDTYLFDSGDGRDVLKNKDTDPLSLDTLIFNDIQHDELWLSRKRNHLFVDVVGSDDQVKIKNWYADEANQVDVIHAADQVLLREQVDLLVSAMASYDVPQGVGAVIPQDARLALEPTLAAAWQNAA